MAWHEILLLVCSVTLALFGVMWTLVLVLERLHRDPKPVSPFKNEPPERPNVTVIDRADIRSFSIVQSPQGPAIGADVIIKKSHEEKSP